jgi:hypothetical protein
LFLISVSNTVHFGSLDPYFFKIGFIQDILAYFRSSGRFFWPVSYLVIFASFLVYSRRFKGLLPSVILILLSFIHIVEFAENARISNVSRGRYDAGFSWVLNKAAKASDALGIYPYYYGTSTSDRELFVRAMLEFSRYSIPVNNAYLARPNRSADEHLWHLEEQFKNGNPPDLRIYLKDSIILEKILQVGEDKNKLRKFDWGYVASDNWDKIDREVPMAKYVFTQLEDSQVEPSKIADVVISNAVPVAKIELFSGFSKPEGWGVWTDGNIARLKIANPENLQAKRLCLSLLYYPYINEKHPELRFEFRMGEQILLERLNSIAGSGGEQIAHLWFSKNDLVKNRGIIELHVFDPKSPLECGLSGDIRRLGLGLTRVELADAEAENALGIRYFQSIYFNTQASSTRDAIRLGNGFGAMENWGTWSVASAAFLEIMSMESISDREFDLALGFYPYINQKHREIRITFFIGDTLLNEETYVFGKCDGEQSVLLRLNISRLKACDGKIRIQIADPISPRECGLFEDSRRLGIGLMRAAILPVLD